MSATYRRWLKDKVAKLQTIDCYSAGATPETVAREIGVKAEQIVKLNFNENLFMNKEKQAGLLRELADEFDFACTLRMKFPSSSPNLLVILMHLKTSFSWATGATS
jgi:hypothetical protein